jgi:hypothetical protein
VTCGFAGVVVSCAGAHLICSGVHTLAIDKLAALGAGGGRQASLHLLFVGLNDSDSV